MIGILLCLMGFHDFRIRKHGEATERVCMRGNCRYTDKLQMRKDDSHVVIYQSKKSYRMRKVQRAMLPYLKEPR